MPVFESDRVLYDVMTDVFHEVSNETENIAPFLQSNLVVRIRFTDPVAEILVDGRQPPLEIFCGERPGDANLEITIAGDLIHDLWLDRESTVEAFFSGRIKTQGNLLKMMKLVDLFRECERVYPQIATAYELS